MYRDRIARQKRRQRTVDEQVNGMGEALDGLKLSGALEDNVALMQRLFTDVDTFRVRRLRSDKDGTLRFALVFCEGMTNREFVEKSIIHPLMDADISDSDLIGHLIARTLKVPEIDKTDNIRQIVEAVCYGDTVLFVEGRRRRCRWAQKNLRRGPWPSRKANAA